MNNTPFPVGSKAKNSWLAGKIKCGRCGAALIVNNAKVSNPSFRCRKRSEYGNCDGCGTVYVRQIEASVYEVMRQRLAEFKTLTGGEPSKANPKLTAMKVELAQVENEIEKLLNTLTGANAILMSYANSKIEELDAKRQSLLMAIADMTAEAISPKQLEQISDYLEDWDNVDFDDRRFVVNGLISSIRATNEITKIEWKF